jgi:hypothetical protein
MICGRPLPPGPEAVQGDIHAPNEGTANGASAPGAAPIASPGRPSRGATAGRPTRRLLDLGLLNFVLVLIGTSSLVAGTWNARRHVEIAELRGVRDRLERERNGLETAIRDERRWYEGIETDPLLRKELLERLLGPSAQEGIPLEEWLRGAGTSPQP